MGAFSAKGEGRGRVLSLAGACELLGVSATALRHWTDEGRVRAFITPGGHRRYREGDLLAFRQGQPRARGVKALATRIEGSVPQHRHLAQDFLVSHPPLDSLPQDCRERFREMGRRLVGLVVRHIIRPSLGEETQRAAWALGREYGRDLAGLGFPLTEALEAFARHRAALVEVAATMLKGHRPVSRRTVDALPQIDRLLDRVLLSLVEAYQQGKGEPCSP